MPTISAFCADLDPYRIATPDTANVMIQRTGGSAVTKRSRRLSSRCPDWRPTVYWDVVEVIPEPDYCLFVRFKDGLQGRVQLHREDLTGALGPLLDMEFFRRVHIDSGAVAWPGN